MPRAHHSMWWGGLVDKKAILVVDDEPFIREYCEDLLTGMGYQCRLAGTCAEAREAFSVSSFACAIIDLGLPDGSGMDVLTDLRQADPLLVCIIMTGDSSASSIVETMREGAFDYLTKPVNAGAIKVAVVRALTHHEALAQQDVLMHLLLDEREQLKHKIEENTRDIRQYAASCEVHNARLQALLKLTQHSAREPLTEEELFRIVFEEICKFVPMVCLALLNTGRNLFIGAIEPERGKPPKVITREVHRPSGEGQDSDMVWMETCIQQHTALQTSELRRYVYPHVLGYNSSYSVGLYFRADYQATDGEQEFLGMCAHHVAAECQMTYLLHHAAQHAGMGGIAIELTKNIIQCLTAIHIASDVVAEIVDSKEASEGLSIIPNRVMFVQDLLREFRSLSHQSSNPTETVDLVRVVEQALIILSVAVQNRQVNLIKEFEADNFCVLISGTTLARTFLFLISRAIRRTPPGGNIRLRLRNMGSDKIRFDIIMELGEQSGTGEEGLSFSEIMDHPSFFLAQRTLCSCAGKLVFETEKTGNATMSIVLPRDVAHARLPLGIPS